MGKTVLEMREISIEFPGVKALDQVDFTTETGSSHALIGANGAGKSTLMKVLCGAYNHYTGEILIDGQKVNIRSPKDAQELGIQIVYQEVDTALIPYLSVAENIMLNETVSDLGKKQFVNWNHIYDEAEKVLKSINVHVPPKKLVSELTLSEKQMVLIARAISRDCKYLILDEPTAPLSIHETEELFRIVRDLRSRNVGIIFISHRLTELFEICDEITVMRNGQFVSKENIPDTTINSVIEQMLGQKLDEQFPPNTSQIGEVLLETHKLNDNGKIDEVSMKVHTGEIVGIAGLVGAGKTEFCKALFGVSPKVTGDITIKGKKVRNRTPHAAVKNGFALVPEERRKEGVLVHETVVTNFSAASLNNFLKVFSFLDFRKESDKAKEMIKSLGVKTPSEQTIVENLSGGNQQKIAIGKWLVADADVYIFDEPTKGVDVGAKKDIFTLITALAERGKSVIYASSELSEIMGISDRIYVMYDGRIVKEVMKKNTDEEKLLLYSTGGN
ncbi:ABC transporter [Jeotgalibacillus alimentarius]|uniref:Ribose/galactose/methyl galactoside import ATP-binding protein n=1 Tax=Jeotgalibacillus alimentarius TaxID=135826 RepID=A0A0C2VCM5_9BACL|nr:sugar ABC transporter ATP-binding protein [Jeotgalibacillus alimentarius]KIL46692.1 ABC transporter [Jeotgalibacillus alimentarius]